MSTDNVIDFKANAQAAAANADAAVLQQKAFEEQRDAQWRQARLGIALTLMKANPDDSPLDCVRDAETLMRTNMEEFIYYQEPDHE